MPISEAQLQTWAQGPSRTETEKIQHTKQMIEEVLKRHLNIPQIIKAHDLSSFNYEVYVQGSYANSTNISLESDVDIVVQLNSNFFPDIRKLSATEQAIHKLHHPDSEYKFIEYKKDIFAALHATFGQSAEYTDKCIRVHENTNRIDADVVPAFEYRLYKRYLSYADQDYVPGMKFFNTDDSTEIINFPKIHLENCAEKNQDTNGRYKETIRVFKNINCKLIESGVLKEKTAPHYFIENLLYSCSNTCFDGTYLNSVLTTLQFLFDAIESKRISGFICANEQYSLFSPTTWNEADAGKFILAVTNHCLKAA